jgi:cytochrome c
MTSTKTMKAWTLGAVTAATFVLAPARSARETARAAEATEPVALGPGLLLPPMDPTRDKTLFASKGCVVCRSVNGVGGTDAPKLDAGTMRPTMSPFDFFAEMWNRAPEMIAMQQQELGGQVTFTGQEIADIVAFVPDAAVQKTFSEADVPAAMKALMEEDDDSRGSSGWRGMMRRHHMMNGGMMGR